MKSMSCVLIYTSWFSCVRFLSKTIMTCQRCFLSLHKMFSLCVSCCVCAVRVHVSPPSTFTFRGNILIFVLFFFTPSFNVSLRQFDVGLGTSISWRHSRSLLTVDVPGMCVCARVSVTQSRKVNVFIVMCSAGLIEAAGRWCTWTHTKAFSCSCVSASSSSGRQTRSRFSCSDSFITRFYITVSSLWSAVTFSIVMHSEIGSFICSSERIKSMCLSLGGLH